VKLLFAAERRLSALLVASPHDALRFTLLARYDVLFGSLAVPAQ
jgi:hypothetical protein